MSLKDQLRNDLTDAMRAKDEVRRSTLRMALTSITNEEVAGEQARDLTDDEVQKVLARELKKRKEAATAFAEAGQAERAAGELAEAKIIESYLPAQLTDEEIAEVVQQAIGELGVTGPGAIGQVMKTVQPRVTGLAEGGRVAAEVKRQLSP